MRTLKTRTGHELFVNEFQAHAIVLAQAIETVDTQGALLGDTERVQLDSDVAKQSREQKITDADIGELLALRANKLLEIVRGRNQAVDLIVGSAHFSRVFLWLIPLVVLIVGVAIDRVVNPHRVDLLSETFLGLMLWNLLIYLTLIWSALGPGKRQPSPILEFVRRWSSAGPIRRIRENTLAAGVLASFIQRWNSRTAALAGQRLRLVMHLAAAAWGAGMALSLILRGMVKAYTVGWESTLWDAETVHHILGVLSWPLTKVLGTAPFSVHDIARLQFEVGTGANGTDARRWLWLYVGILVLFVVLPRMGLALVAYWRSRQLIKSIPIDISEAYFQRIIGNLIPANVRLGLVVHEPDDRTSIRNVLVQESAQPSNRISSHQDEQRLIATTGGDALWMIEMPVRPDHSPSGPNNPSPKWILSIRRMFSFLPDALLEPKAKTESQVHTWIDVVGHVVSQPSHLVTALPMLQESGRPILILVRSGSTDGHDLNHLLEECERHKHIHDMAMEVLPFEDFARCWVLERNLLNLIARYVPRSKARGCARLVAAWEQRNRQRFQDSMSEISAALEFSVRQFQEIPSLSLFDRASSEKRRTHEARKSEAMSTVRDLVKKRDDELVERLRQLHRLESWALIDLPPDSEGKEYEIEASMSAPAAIMGGVGTGAAMGASIDAVTGGITLGAAAALGALAGGSAALAGVIWRNHYASHGGIRISYSDAMLMALFEACLCRYLQVIHFHRESAHERVTNQSRLWKSLVHAESMSRRKELIAAFDQGRKGESIRSILEGKTEEVARQVLSHLFPGSRSGNFSHQPLTLEGAS